MKLGGGYVYTECEPGDAAAEGHATSSRADSVVCGHYVDGRSGLGHPEKVEPQSCTRFWYTKDRLQHRGAPLQSLSLLCDAPFLQNVEI